MPTPWKLILTLALVAPGLSGCWMGELWAREAAEREAARVAANDRAAQAWVKRSFADMIAEMGPPTKTFDDPTGLKIYVYTRESEHVSPAKVETESDNKGHITTTSYPETRTVTRFHRMFFVDKKGVITRATWKDDSAY
jgi:hypothetical protein